MGAYESRQPHLTETRGRAIEGAQNEQTFAWENVSVGADDRTLTLSGVHSAPFGTSSGTRWAFSRTIVEETDEAVCVRVILVERALGAPAASLLVGQTNARSSRREAARHRLLTWLNSATT